MSPLELLAPMLIAIGGALLMLVAAGLVSLWKPAVAQRIGTWLAPTVAFLAGGFLIRGFPSFPPSEAAEWVIWSVALVAIVATFTSRVPAWARWGGRIVAVAALTYAISEPLIGRSWEGNEAVGWVAGIALVWLLIWSAMLQAERASPSWKPLLVLLMASVGLSVVLMISGTASYSQYILALAGAIAGAGLAALPFIRRFGVDPRPAPAMIAIPWGGLLVAGDIYAEMPLSAAALTAAATFALFFPILPKVKNFSGWKMLAAQLVWMILLLGIAAYLAHQAAPKYDYY